jgi:hypothetical protein
LTRLFQQRNTAIAKQTHVARETTALRQQLFSQLVEVAGVLWPSNTPLTCLQIEKTLTLSNLWGLCGPELMDDEDKGKLPHHTIIIETYKNPAPASKLETLILCINDLKNQLQSIHNQAVAIQNKLMEFRLQTANNILQLGAEVFPAELWF